MRSKTRGACGSASRRSTRRSPAPDIHIKKGLIAQERDRPALRQARREWISRRQPRMRQEPHRLVFIPLGRLLRNRLPGSGRNCRQNQPDPPARAGAEGRTPLRQRSVRALGDPDLHRRAVGRRADRPLGHQRRYGSRRLRHLRQNPARTGAGAGHRCHSRQPVDPQKSARGSGASGKRLLVPVPAAVQPRPEPHLSVHAAHTPAGQRSNKPSQNSKHICAASGHEPSTLCSMPPATSATCSPQTSAGTI